ncbi:rhodanese-related sulfurtransferase [Methylophilaceae bacterium]|nr:rhodanese-related sulfurtransferase [Methylophilaceae bacterium]|tara:strand:- start:479 stop:1408 length:930 start_codon:yes stop_codon:yes gene_type:complete
MFLTIAFYHFVSLENIKQFQPFIQKFCQKNNIKGTILLASEGINGTISGQDISIHNFLRFIRDDSFFNDNFKNLEHKESWAEKNPFYRMKVRLKKEIVALGVDGISPTKKVGKYVTPEEWNNLIKDPNTIVIDTRNNYEVDIGTFKNSINPKTESFREFPAYVDNNLKNNKSKKVAMFCTGGIRCEKATSLMLEKGFKDVYHLKGGILKYLENIPQEQSLWEGECFVFDQRVAVTHGLNEGQYDQCYACRHPLSPSELISKKYDKGISCPYCFNKLSDKKQAGVIERQKQMVLAKARGEKHIGDNQNKK